MVNGAVKNIFSMAFSFDRLFSTVLKEEHYFYGETSQPGGWQEGLISKLLTYLTDPTPHNHSLPISQVMESTP
jgi:hypothetical protein